MRVKGWILNRRSGLLEDGIGIGGEFDIHPFLFKTGEFTAVMDGGQGLPHEDGDQSYTYHSTNDAKDDANDVDNFRTVSSPVDKGQILIWIQM